MTNTIGFLVKKPAQFDVPFFRYIASQESKQWKFVVIYLENPTQLLHDQELKASSNWGINLIDGYEWHFLKSAEPTDIQALFAQLNIAFLLTNGYKLLYAPFITAAKASKIPIGLRIDSILTGKSTMSLLLRKWTMRWAYRSFQGFFTTGKKGIEYLNYIGIPSGKQFWFPYCTDNDFFALGPDRIETINRLATTYQIDLYKPILLGVCKFIERENPVDLLQAFILLNDPNLQLIMIGDGDLASDLHYQASLHPHLSIVFPGYVAYTELPYWYAMTTVFVHPAQDEPWGVSVQEAIAAGCSVVASNKVGSAFDLIVPGKNGFIYPVNHPRELADSLRKMLELPKGLVKTTNEEILGKWNYAAVWEHLKAAVEKLV